MSESLSFKIPPILHQRVDMSEYFKAVNDFKLQTQEIFFKSKITSTSEYKNYLKTVTQKNQTTFQKEDQQKATNPFTTRVTPSFLNKIDKKMEDEKIKRENNQEVEIKKEIRKRKREEEEERRENRNEEIKRRKEGNDQKEKMKKEERRRKMEKRKKITKKWTRKEQQQSEESEEEESEEESESETEESEESDLEKDKIFYSFEELGFFKTSHPKAQSILQAEPNKKKQLEKLRSRIGQGQIVYLQCSIADQNTSPFYSKRFKDGHLFTAEDRRRALSVDGQSWSEHKSTKTNSEKHIRDQAKASIFSAHGIITERDLNILAPHLINLLV